MGIKGEGYKASSKNRKLPSDLVGYDCEHCVKKEVDKEGFITCPVLKKFYFDADGAKRRCFAFCGDLMEWYQAVSGMYDRAKDGSGTQTLKRRYRAQLQSLRARMDNGKYEGIREAYNANRKKTIKFGGGGDSERTHKPVKSRGGWLDKEIRNMDPGVPICGD